MIRPLVVVLVALGSVFVLGCTEPEVLEPDNTAVNARDRDPANVTADDAGNSPADVELAQKIRSEITGNDSLSTTAKNVKVIAQDGQVTLRGPVASPREKEIIVATATRVAGRGQVIDDLEVTM